MTIEWIISMVITALLFPFVGYYFKRVNQAITALELKTGDHETRLVRLETERDIRIAFKQAGVTQSQNVVLD